MKKKSINKSREIIKRYCESFIAMGGQIKSGAMNVYDASSYKPIAHCAMGVIGYPNNICDKNSDKNHKNQMEIISKSLGWGDKEIWSFVSGFDDQNIIEKKSRKHFELGQQFRKFYITKEIDSL